MRTKTKRIIDDAIGIIYPLSVPILALVAGEMTRLACVVTCGFMVLGNISNLLKRAPKDRSVPSPTIPPV